MQIAKDIFYVGVNDHEVDLFEGQFVVPLGMSYNSYVIKDEKVAVMDTVDARFFDEWLAKIKSCTDKVDYLVVLHMESDHSACIKRFAEVFPEATIVSSQQAFQMMQAYFSTSFEERRIVVKEGDVLDLGVHKLSFVSAPMVHWPEVMVAYDTATKSLFSADGFGKFGALDKEDPEGWDCEARRYYFGIVGKFGQFVQQLLKKASTLPIERILPLHGPVHDTPEMIAHVIEKYKIWSSYEVESPGVLIAYTTVYGNTRNAVLRLAEVLKEKGCPKVVIADLARDDIHETVEDAFRYGKVILATTTYNSGIFPYMRQFIDHLVSRNYQNRKIGFLENGTWAPMAAKSMKSMLEGLKNISFCGNVVTIKGALKAADDESLGKLADEILL
jgi:flavorubredoxin